MDTIWTRHRFSGGALALDVANSVVLRIDPARRFDRFDEAAEIARFAQAAGSFRADELGGRALEAHEPARMKPRLIALREATDALFRSDAGGAADRGQLAGLLTACAEAIGTRSGTAWGSGAAQAEPMPLETATALSALSLLDGTRRARIRICANCGWLFLDSSRNRSRIWCDMTVCGNRQKARRHYRRRTQESADAD